jgi:hypothetical protein
MNRTANRPSNKAKTQKNKSSHIKFTRNGDKKKVKNKKSEIDDKIKIIYFVQNYLESK